MRAPESSHVVHGGDERRRGHRPHAGHRGEMLEHLIGRDEPHELIIQGRDLFIDGTEEFYQRRDHRHERGLERQFLQPREEGLGRSRAEATPLPPHERLDPSDPRGCARTGSRTATRARIARRSVDVRWAG
jgi:hypothetical protein